MLRLAVLLLVLTTSACSTTTTSGGRATNWGATAAGGGLFDDQTALSDAAATTLDGVASKTFEHCIKQPTVVEVVTAPAVSASAAPFVVAILSRRVAREGCLPTTQGAVTVRAVINGLGWQVDASRVEWVQSFFGYQVQSVEKRTAKVRACASLAIDVLDVEGVETTSSLRCTEWRSFTGKPSEWAALDLLQPIFALPVASSADRL